MAVRRRRTQRPEAVRVVKVTSDGQWEKLQAQLGDRLMLIHFSATWATPSQQFKPNFKEMAKRPQFSHVVFVEIDVDQLSELAQGLGVKACPTIICWKNGGCVEMSERGQGANPARLVEMLDRHAGAKPSQPRWQAWLFKAVVVVTTVAAAGFAFQQVRHQQGQTSEARAAVLNEQLKTVKQSLTLAKRRRQSKIVQQLKAQLERLSHEREEVERILQAATRNAAATDTASGSSGGFGPSGGDAAVAAAADASDYSSDEEAPVAAPAAAFSDSEVDNFDDSDAE